MPQEPTPPDGEPRPSEYEPPAAADVGQDDTVATVGIVNTGQDNGV